VSLDSAHLAGYARRMIRRVYDWTLSLAARKTAQVWLAVIAFVESSFFLVPADVLFLPMALSRPERAYRYALIATLASTLGGIAGYMLGAFAYDAVAKPVLQFYGKLAEFERLRACAGRETTMLLLVTSGLSHLPPIKVVTILSGVVDVGITFFIVSCLVARGARFYVLAWALRSYGVPIKAFIERRLGLIAGIAALVLIGLYFAVRSFAGSGMLTACT
jgi:membrane protein YqaA with SNARE-associated domain